MPIYLDALALKFYRGIGPEMQFIGPFSDMNFFIGANNSGKSTVLNFINNELHSIGRQNTGNKSSEITDRYRGDEEGNLNIVIGISREKFRDNVYETHKTHSSSNFFSTEVFNTIWDEYEFNKHICTEHEFNKCIWIENTQAGNGTRNFLFPNNDPHVNIYDEKLWFHLWSALTNQSGGSFQRQWYPQALKAMLDAQRFSFPEVKLIPAKRELGPKGEAFVDQSGTGLIDELAALQSPDHDERERKKVFDKINEFVRAVTDKPSAKIEVPYHREHLLVHMDNKVLPLSSLGTGIHEVILIAAFCTIHQEQIICIEEPEIHLHPILQRKLIQYLQDNTVNQYFIATHSAAFIDTPNASVFRVENDGVQTRIAPAVLKQDRRQICDELGYKASDILQTNAIIWVEGPSDRIYLRHWLSKAVPEFQEGTHFSILFYGGRLLSHLSADAEDVQDFIDLRSLNQNTAVVIDSDKTSARASIGKTKERLKEELSDERGVVWITKGREIENYIEHSKLQSAIKERHSTIYESPADGGKFDHAFYFNTKRTGSKKSEVYSATDKVGVAKIVCNHPAELGVLDLNERIDELVKMIKTANSL